MGHIQRYHLSDALVAVPPTAVLNTANSVFMPLMDRWLANALESRTLTQLRDFLLPKLLSGEIRVHEADAKIAASV